jgi:hypothetical protein
MIIGHNYIRVTDLNSSAAEKINPFLPLDKSVTVAYKKNYFYITLGLPGTWSVK